MKPNLKKALSKLEQSLELLASETSDPKIAAIFDKMNDAWNELEAVVLNPEEREQASKAIDWDEVSVNTRGIEY